MNFMQVKKLRPALAFKSPFSIMEAQLFQYRKSRPATSSQVKRMSPRGQGFSQFFNLDKIHQILAKSNLNNMNEYQGGHTIIHLSSF